jgi:AraC family transcriptional regulator
MRSAVARTGREALLSWNGHGIQITREWRAPHTEGPRNARHATTLELCLIEEGEDVASIEGRLGVATAGQYAVIAPDAVHSSWTERRSSTQTIVHIPVELLAESAHALGASFQPGRFDSAARPTPPELAATVGALRHHAAARAADRGSPTVAPAQGLLVTSLVTHLSVWLAREHLLDGERAAPTVATPHARAKVRAVERRMREEPEHAHALESLAAQAGLSRFHFLRLFKREFGLTPHAHLLRLRAEKAAQLLSDTELSTTAIAFELGFSSTSALISTFKRLHGDTPHRWRARRAPASAISR